MRRSCLVAVGAVVVGTILPLQSFAQVPSRLATPSDVPESVVMANSTVSAPDATFEQATNYRSLSNGPAVAVGVKFGTLGIGIQAAAQVASRLNVRGGYNAFSYDHTFDQSGATIDGTLKLGSVEANLDLLVGGGFRVSPGLLLYNHNHVDGTLSVPAGSSFSIGGQNYISQAADPIRGTALMSFNSVSPMLTLGFGQMVPRSGRHFSVQFDLGVVFEDSPAVTLAYGGTGCIVTTPQLPAAIACKPINSQPNIVAAIADEQQKWSDAVKILKYYPIMSLGFGWRF